jgi:FAD synthase
MRVVLSGIVTPFQGNGRQFGYPTANITANTQLADGIYFGYASLAQYVQQPALVFVGVPVTVGDTQRRVEVHLLDIPDTDYYGLPLHITIEHFHRPNKKFTDVPTLLQAITDDDRAGRDWFAKSQQTEDN